MSKKNKNNSKGFTLIELLIVIAIIGILAATVLVNLNGARTRARDISAYQIMESAGKAAQVCLISGGTLVPATNYVAPTVGGPTCNPANGSNWPQLPSSWSIAYIVQSGEWYWLRATSTDGKVIICDYSPETWGPENGISGSLFYKCRKVGF